MASHEEGLFNAGHRNDKGKNRLCKYCQSIDFDDFSREPRVFNFGTKRELALSAQESPFCQLIWSSGADASYYESDREIKVEWKEDGFYAIGSQSTRIVFLSEESTKTAYGYGRLIREQTPIELPRSWLRTCEKHHVKCKPLPLHFGVSPGRMNQPLRFLRLIDLHEERLVEISTQCRYVALSYMWGLTSSLKLLNENLTTLSLKGGLKAGRTELSQTVRDAMSLVLQLGERYLWIDALCLVQDNPEDMVHGIENMDVIYESALMTIIAANGQDQNSGLTGLNGTKRDIRQFCREVVPGVKMTITQGVHKHLAVARYSSRGWTMQEQVLSHRCLIFLENLVYFYCRSGYFSEDTIWDQHPTELCPEELTEASVVTNFLLTDGNDPVSEYHNQLIRYTSRDLTKPDIDAIYAFLGILTRLAASTNSGLLCGLLTSAFDICLLFWHPRFWQNNQGEARRRPSFPSWSWAGWSGVALLVIPEDGSDQKHSLSVNSEDIIYNVYGLSSLTRGVTHGGTGIAHHTVRPVWGSNDRARLGPGHSGDNLNTPERDYTSSADSVQVNWNAIPRDYEILYFHALTIRSFQMRLSKFGNVLVWPRTSDDVEEQDDSSYPLLASLAAGNFVPSDVRLYSEELGSGQEFDIVLLSRAERHDSFHLSWLNVGNVNPWDEAEAGLDTKPDRPVIWALLVVRERAHFRCEDVEEKIQVFYERRALGFIYQDRLKEFEGIIKGEVILA